MEWDKAMTVDGKMSFHVTVAVFDQKLADSFDSFEEEIVGSKNQIESKYLERFLSTFPFLFMLKTRYVNLTCGF